MSDEERRTERGAFFGSIQKTLSHLMWADQLWISRFRGAELPRGGIPESVALYPDWEQLKHLRASFDTDNLNRSLALDSAPCCWLIVSGTWQRNFVRLMVAPQAAAHGATHAMSRAGFA